MYHKQTKNNTLTSVNMYCAHIKFIILNLTTSSLCIFRILFSRYRYFETKFHLKFYEFPQNKDRTPVNQLPCQSLYHYLHATVCYIAEYYGFIMALPLQHQIPIKSRQKSNFYILFGIPLFNSLTLFTKMIFISITIKSTCFMLLHESTYISY